MKSYQNLIAGSWQPAQSGQTFRTVNPADARETVANYPLSGSADVFEAIAAAKDASRMWAMMPAIERGRTLSKTSQIIETRKTELAALLTREEGKTLAESMGEVQRAADIFRFFGGRSYQAGGHTIPADLPKNLLYTRREPLGVVGLITPWNFPIAIPAWKLAPALVSGNAVVLKPASQTPAMALELGRILGEAGLPAGVLNVVVGDGRSVGGEIAAHPDIVALSFTGSFPIGHQLYQQLSQRMARAQMEMGGKNPTIVLADGDLDLAAKLVAIGGFGLTGQACTATSRVLVEKRVAAEFSDKLVARAQAIRVGNGLNENITMGPAISEQQLTSNLNYVADAVAEGATLLWGGERLSGEGLAYGSFMSPTVLTKVTPEMRIAREEVFGPVVSIIEVDNFDEALAIANSVDVGLCASLITRDFRKALLFTELIEAGVVKVNQVSTGLALQAPFGGMKKSSSGSFKEQGDTAVEFYSRVKTIYLDYSAEASFEGVSATGTR
jgi:aldehyde dehydrogenase (NAD+)